MPSATTTLGATGYTTAASWTNNVTLATHYRPDPLKIKTGPDGSLLDYHNHTNTTMANQKFTVREVIDYSYGGTVKWCREWFNNQVAFCGYQKSDGTLWTTAVSPSCTYGQIRVTGGTVTASRDSSSSTTVNVSATVNYQIAQAPLESYYNWQVYLYMKNPGGGEAQAQIYNRAKTWSTGTGSKTITFSFTETSGNTTISSVGFGVWGNGNGVTYNMNPSNGVSSTFTMNIPKYVASPVKKWNGSSWVTVPIKKWNGSSWVDVPVKKWNGSSWVQIP